MLEANKGSTCSSALEGKVNTCPQTMPVRRGEVCSIGLRLRSGEGMELSIQLVQLGNKHRPRRVEGHPLLLPSRTRNPAVAACPQLPACLPTINPVCLLLNCLC